MMSYSPLLGFYLFFAGLTALLIYTVLPYVGLFILAFVWVVVTAPWHKTILQYVPRPGLAAVTTTILTVTTILVPLYIFLLIALNQFSTYFSELQQNLRQDPTPLVEAQTRVTEWFPFVNLSGGFDGILASIGSFVQSIAIPLVSGGITVIVSSVIFFVTLIYFYLEKDNFILFLKRIVPLPREEKGPFVDRIVASINTIMGVIVLSAGAQAVAAIIPMVLLGIPAPLFWFFAVFFAGFLPFGAGLVTVPMSILLLVVGNFWGGLALLLWHAFVVSSIDNVVRARMFKVSAVQLPELITIMSSLGGIVTFGFLGIIFGPLIAIMFMACLEVIERRSGGTTRPPRPMID